MASYSGFPTIEQLLGDSTNVAGVRHQVEMNGTVLEFLLQPDRISIYRGHETMPFAVLRFGGPYSGAIWLDDQLIGEFERDKSGNFVVTEIEAGFILPESRRQEDPVTHLLSQLQVA